MNRTLMLENLPDLLEELDARLTALEAKPQAPPTFPGWEPFAKQKAAEVKRLTAELADRTAERDTAWQETDALKTQRNALAAQVDDLRNVNAGLRKHNASQQDLIAAVRSRSLRRLEAIKNQWDVDAALRADNAKLRAALEAVEWITDPDHHDETLCPWCGSFEDDDHRPDCQRQAALR